MKTLTVAAAALAAVITACSTAPMQAQTSAAPSQTPTVRIQTTSVGVVATGSTDALTMGSKGPVVGVNLYAVHNYTAAQTTADGERTLAYIKDDLHASAVDLVWNFYAPSYTSDSVVTSVENTLTPADIGILTQIAQHEGLYVEYRPLMFVDTTGNDWEGLIKSANPGAWFTSYYAQNLPYLKMAQKYHINEYVIGTEMDGLLPDPQWVSLLDKAAEIFKGPISYASHQTRYFTQYPQFPATSLTGVDMYKQTKLRASASLSMVTSTYEAFFTGMPAALLRRTAIQETGIEARAGAYQSPAALGTPGILDVAIQYNWFMAGCEAVKRFHLRGIFFWKVDLADYPVTHPASSLSTFEGRSGAVAISKCASIINS
jgi:hypothetical protein